MSLLTRGTITLGFLPWNGKLPGVIESRIRPAKQTLLKPVFKPIIRTNAFTCSFKEQPPKKQNQTQSFSCFYCSAWDLSFVSWFFISFEKLASFRPAAKNKMAALFKSWAVLLSGKDAEGDYRRWLAVINRDARRRPTKDNQWLLNHLHTFAILHESRPG